MDQPRCAPVGGGGVPQVREREKWGLNEEGRLALGKCSVDQDANRSGEEPERPDAVSVQVDTVTAHLQYQQAQEAFYWRYFFWSRYFWALHFPTVALWFFFRDKSQPPPPPPPPPGPGPPKWQNSLHH